MTKPVSAPKGRKPRAQPRRAPPAASLKPPTKLATVIALVSRAKGANLAELQAATGWQAHSIRGALAGALRKKGHVIISTVEDGVRCYRIETTA